MAKPAKRKIRLPKQVMDELCAILMQTNDARRLLAGYLMGQGEDATQVVQLRLESGVIEVVPPDA